MKAIKILTLVFCLIFISASLFSCNNEDLPQDENKKETEEVIQNNNPNNCKHDDPTQVVILKEKDPTCQESGLTEGMKCNLCGTMVMPQATVPTINCKESSWIIDKEPSPEGDGKRHTECIMCKKTMAQETLLKSSQGLRFSLTDGTYEIYDIGSCKDTEIVIPAFYEGIPVTRIGNDAFWYCDSLTSITIPDSVTSIGIGAFEGCTNLTSINIPEGVTSIEKGAFSGCTNLKSINIPKGVTSIGTGAFTGYALERITVDNKNAKYRSENNCLIEKDTNTLILACKNSTIPSGIKKIGHGAFARNDLTSITIPNSVTSIDDVAFAFCKNLKSITIPNSVKSIGEEAFASTGITSISFTGTVAEWDAITKEFSWNYDTPATEVVCSGGTVALR